MYFGIGEYATVLIVAVSVIFCYLPLTAALITILTIISSILWKLHRVNNYWVKQGISGPKPNLIFGNLLQLKNGFKAFDIENTKKYGNRFGAVFAGVPTFITSDLDLLREVLVKQFNCFVNREIRNITYNENSVGSRMMLVLKDQLWKDVRRTVTPAFSSAKMKNMIPLLEECIADLLDACERTIDEANGVFEAKELCGNYTMDAIAKCAFGVNAGSQHGDSLFARYARQILGFTFSNPRIIFITLFPNVARHIENFIGRDILNHGAKKYIVDEVRKVIKERRINPKKGKPDFLQLLLDCYDKGDAEDELDCEITDDVVSKGGHKIELSEDLIISQCFIFLVAGYETSSATLQFCLYNLATHPVVQEKGYEEVIQVAGKKELIEYDDLRNMPYIDQIIKETLRLFPPIPRFSPEERQANDPLTFIPFGFGPRNCIGMRFAQLEMRLALAYLLKHFKFFTNDKTPKPPLDITVLPFTKPAVPIYLTVVRR